MRRAYTSFISATFLMIFHGAPVALAQTVPAGSPSIPNDVTIKLAKDLANLQQAIQAACSEAGCRGAL
jgi:hypothetical protein